MMILEPGFMRSLTDAELVAALRQVSDELTDTPVERELLRRFEKVTPDLSDFVIEDAQTTAELLDVLADEEYDDPAQLAKDLKIIRQIKPMIKKLETKAFKKLINILTELE